MAKPVEITDENFQSEILESEMPALVDFGAAWCPPCRALEPIIEELVDEFAGRIKIGTVNVDNCKKTSGTYGVMSVPTLVFFKNGKEVDRIVGFGSKDDLVNKIEAQL
jgi:thioredoxin